MNSNGLNEHKFTVYSRSLSLKYQSLVTCIYDHLDVEELKQLGLTVEEAKITDLDFSRHVQNVGKHVIKKRILFNVVLVTLDSQQCELLYLWKMLFQLISN